MSERKKVRQVKTKAPRQEDRESFQGKTHNQREYIRSMIENVVTFGIGPAGTGKSYCALGLASEYLLDGKTNQIVIARPTVEASPRGLGFLPGDKDSKMSPYVYPALEHLKRFLGINTYNNAMRDGKIKIEALEYLRGRTFDNSFMIGEEFQNATTDQLKMFITRIGKNSKIVIDGDIEQSDMKKTNSDYPTDLEYVITKLKKANLKGFSIVELQEIDIMRNPILQEFLRVKL